MANAKQQLFKTIVLHNKLMAEADCDALLNRVPAPEDAIKDMVVSKVVPQALGGQLLALYRKKLEKLLATESTKPLIPQAPTASAPPPPPPAPTVQPAEEPIPLEPEPMAAAPAPGATPATATAPAAPSGPVMPAVALPETITVAETVDTSAGGSQLLTQLLQIARNLKASDLHIRAGTPPLVRVAGRLHELALPPLSATVAQETLLATLPAAGQATFAQTSDLTFGYQAPGAAGRWRATLLQQHGGSAGIFHGIGAPLPTLDELHLPPAVKRLADTRSGLVLVTGPRGSGKTSTLAALVDHINTSRSVHILSIEDPVEFVHAGKKAHVSQQEIGAHAPSTAAALRAALPAAADVIVVGDLDEPETLALALAAAEAGRLVLGTLPAATAVQAVDQVLQTLATRGQDDLRPVFAAVLRGIVAQTLRPGANAATLEPVVEVLLNTPAIADIIREAKASQLRGTMAAGTK